MTSAVRVMCHDAVIAKGLSRQFFARSFHAISFTQYYTPHHYGYCGCWWLYGFPYAHVFVKEKP
jgi:hypothetical protein